MQKNRSSIKPNGPYEAVVIRGNASNVLELRVTILALRVESTGLRNINIHEWLCKIGNQFIDEVEGYKVALITAADVSNRQIVGSWKEREINKKG
ncbi:hypothetical protein [Ornithinibacillus bavariensis]|uniref:hypothetical protein n=1 Tax=Ornithinibacillus bavariensis TaxID=545502 RepID=UPI000ED74B5E|nr:hypothetical protein [Ornithinibacillus sp.]